MFICQTFSYSELEKNEERGWKMETEITLSSLIFYTTLCLILASFFWQKYFALLCQLVCIFFLLSRGSINHFKLFHSMLIVMVDRLHPVLCNVKWWIWPFQELFPCRRCETVKFYKVGYIFCIPSLELVYFGCR